LDSFVHYLTNIDKEEKSKKDEGIRDSQKRVRAEYAKSVLEGKYSCLTPTSRTSYNNNNNIEHVNDLKKEALKIDMNKVIKNMKHKDKKKRKRKRKG